MDSSVFTTFIEMNDFLKKRKKKKEFNEEFILLRCDTHLKKKFWRCKIMKLNKKKNLHCFLFWSAPRNNSIQVFKTAWAFTFQTYGDFPPYVVQFYSNCTVDLSVIELIWLYFLIEYFAFQLILVLFFQVRMQIPLLQIEASTKYFSIHIFPLTSLIPFANKPSVTDKLSAVEWLL